MVVNILIQARMSSARYPGKVLAPLNGKPLISHIVDRALQVKGVDKVIVVTSQEASDDPLASYLDATKQHCFRGPLDNVFERFKLALQEYPCDFFIRLCADSPLLNPAIIEYMLEQVKSNKHDVVSNVINRRFPKGQSVEIIKTQAFQNIDTSDLTAQEQEHVMPYFYNRKNDFKILSIEKELDESHKNMCVDTIDDMNNVAQMNSNYNFQQESVCLKEY